ncbi:hypothetical protein DFH09DRAFT_1273944 [Mycena vulgaris]|nr:hypothetical protein DFH09DRAFT_1273944 [Mycena vulgaris]
MKYTFWDFVKSTYDKQQPVVTADLTGKTVVVLGANTGIGFETAKHFATMNPERLILACRSQRKGQLAVEKLKAATSCTTAELWIIDLADFASVSSLPLDSSRTAAGWISLSKTPALGALTYAPTKDGWESSLQVNCLSTHLLALLLLPTMLKTAKEHSTFPRIVVVASGVHFSTTIEKPLSEDPAMLKTMGGAEYCAKNMGSRYGQTKLLNVFFFCALNARLLPATPLIVDAAAPGYCYSELRRSLTGIRAFVDYIMERLLARTAEEGSRHIIWAALAHQNDADKLRGEYIARGRVEEVSDFVLSAQGAKLQDRIWDEMVEILAKVDPKVTATVDQYLSPPAA